MNNTPFFAPVNSFGIDVSKKDFGDKIALIDSDYLKYYVTASMYKKIMDEGMDHSKAILNETIDYYLGRDIFDRFKAKSYVFCFSAPSHKVFRNAITQEKEYKGHRKNQKDSTYYPDKYEDMAYIYSYINDRYPTLYFDDLEADDLVSFLQDQENTFIYSNDKDLKQVPGFHYMMDSGTLKFTSEEEGMKLLLSQVLLGDSTDNFSGLAGFGKVSLQKFLDQNSNITDESMLFMTIKKFIDKFGVMNGIDTFVEMWSIASMKIDRGVYFKEKYSKAYLLKESLLK